MIYRKKVININLKSIPGIIYHIKAIKRLDDYSMKKFHPHKNVLLRSRRNFKKVSIKERCNEIDNNYHIYRTESGRIVIENGNDELVTFEMDSGRYLFKEFEISIPDAKRYFRCKANFISRYYCDPERESKFMKDTTLAEYSRRKINRDMEWLSQDNEDTACEGV